MIYSVKYIANGEMHLETGTARTLEDFIENLERVPETVIFVTTREEIGTYH
jgi:hypothetical protein